MTQLISRLYRDEAGFIVSAELVLVATIAVLGMLVGLSEVANNINQELEDVGSAFAGFDQSFQYCSNVGHKGQTAGGGFTDYSDYCEGQFDIYGTAGGSER